MRRTPPKRRRRRRRRGRSSRATRRRGRCWAACRRPRRSGSTRSSARSRRCSRCGRCCACEDRARYMRRMAQAIIDELDALAREIGREQGRPRAEVAALELLPAIDALIWIADDGAKVLGGRRVGIHRSMSLARRARIAYEPYGVIGVIGAGSAPFAQPLGQIAGALLAGNGVVFKPAARACLTAERIARVLARADLPEGLVALAHGDARVGVALAGAPVAKVLFTGSPAVGREVARACVSAREGGDGRARRQGRDARARRLQPRTGGRRRAVGGVRGRGPGARGGRARVRRARGLRALPRAARRRRAGARPSATPSGWAGTRSWSARSPRGGGWSTSASSSRRRWRRARRCTAAARSRPRAATARSTRPRCSPA